MNRFIAWDNFKGKNIKAKQEDLKITLRTKGRLQTAEEFQNIQQLITISCGLRQAMCLPTQEAML